MVLSSGYIFVLETRDPSEVLALLADSFSEVALILKPTSGKRA